MTPGDVAGGNVHFAGNRHHDLRVVLTYAAAQGKSLVRRRLYGCCARYIFHSIMHHLHDVESFGVGAVQFHAVVAAFLPKRQQIFADVRLLCRQKKNGVQPIVFVVDCPVHLCLCFYMYVELRMRLFLVAVPEAIAETVAAEGEIIGVYIDAHIIYHLTRLRFRQAF